MQEHTDVITEHESIALDQQAEAPVEANIFSHWKYYVILACLATIIITGFIYFVNNSTNLVAGALFFSSAVILGLFLVVWFISRMLMQEH